MYVKISDIVNEGDETIALYVDLHVSGKYMDLRIRNSYTGANETITIDPNDAKLMIEKLTRFVELNEGR